MSYIIIEEVGPDETSGDRLGRQLSVPTNLLFDLQITNYTSRTDYILDTVVVQVTYESNLDKACSLVIAATKKVTKEFKESVHEQPFIRLGFAPSGVDISVKYSTLVRERGRVASEITEEIYRSFKKNRDVEIAYPHTEIVLKKRR